MIVKSFMMIDVSYVDMSLRQWSMCSCIVTSFADQGGHLHQVEAVIQSNQSCAAEGMVWEGLNREDGAGTTKKKNGGCF